MVRMVFNGERMIDLDEGRIESAARLLCSIRLIDPEERVYAPASFYDDRASGFGATSEATIIVARWEIVAEEVRKHIEIEKAIYSST